MSDERPPPGPTAATPEPPAATLVERRLGQPRWAFETLIDRGGMGLIERVRDAHLDRAVARKVLAPKLRGDSKSVRYFLREAWITARLAHPAVVPIHELSTDDEGRLCFSMKLVDGEHLGKKVLAREGAALSEEALFEDLNVILRVCEALELAHTHNIIHRDLKPDNVMVGAFGAVYLMDWGIAAEGPGGAGIPEDLVVDDTGAAVGTPAYMAPEQATGQRVDARTDVYGVGGLIHFVLTGHPPHRGASVMDVLQRAAYEPVEAPSEAYPERQIPRALERIVMRALARQPAERYERVGDMAKDLRRFMRGGGDFPRTQVRRGEHVIHEGEHGDAAYIIVSGRLRVLRTLDGEQRHLRVMGRGEVFGEMAILGSGLRTASVVALEDSELLVVTRETLQREVGDMKPWVGAVVRTLARRFEQRERELLSQVSSAKSSRAAAQLPLPRVLQLVSMLAQAWCEPVASDEGLVVRFGELATQIRALAGVDRIRLVSILRAQPAIKLDLGADELRIVDPEALRMAARQSSV